MGRAANVAAATASDTVTQSPRFALGAMESMGRAANVATERIAKSPRAALDAVGSAFDSVRGKDSSHPCLKTRGLPGSDPGFPASRAAPDEVVVDEADWRSTLRYLGLWLRRAFGKAQLTVDVYSASDLYNADGIHGLSDPWIKLSVGRRQKRTKTVENTLHPVYRERFVFDEERFQDLLVRPPLLQLYDEDVRRDEELGEAELHYHGMFCQLAAAVEAGGTATRSYTMELSTQGTIDFDIRIDNARLPPWKHVLPLLFAFPIDIGKRVAKELPIVLSHAYQTLREGAEQAMNVHHTARRVDVTLVVIKGVDLMNVDDDEALIAFFQGRQVLSDPYVAGPRLQSNSPALGPM